MATLNWTSVIVIVVVFLALVSLLLSLVQITNPITQTPTSVLAWMFNQTTTTIWDFIRGLF